MIEEDEEPGEEGPGLESGTLEEELTAAKLEEDEADRKLLDVHRRLVMAQEELRRGEDRLSCLQGKKTALEEEVDRMLTHLNKVVANTESKENGVEENDLRVKE